jgi:aminoglycoside 6'-N-acetyltransferase
MPHDTFQPSYLPAALTGDMVLLRPMRQEELRGVVTTMAADTVVSRVWSSDPGKLRHWLQTPDSVVFVVEDPAAPGKPLGIVQATSHREDPDYEAASLDIGLFEGSRGRGLGPDVLRTVARWLFDACGFHRITIDPAAGNAAAVRAYEKAGFVRIGVARLYERGDDGKWHDNVLLDLLPEDLVGATEASDVAAEPHPEPPEAQAPRAREASPGLC